jgi:hypothetical protein
VARGELVNAVGELLPTCEPPPDVFDHAVAERQVEGLPTAVEFAGVTPASRDPLRRRVGPVQRPVAEVDHDDPGRPQSAPDPVVDGAAQVHDRHVRQIGERLEQTTMAPIASSL